MVQGFSVLPSPLHYPLATMPESRVVLFGLAVLVETFCESLEFAPITCGRLRLHVTKRVGGLNQWVKRVFGL